MKNNYGSYQDSNKVERELKNFLRLPAENLQRVHQIQTLRCHMDFQWNLRSPDAEDGLHEVRHHKDNVHLVFSLSEASQGQLLELGLQFQSLEYIICLNTRFNRWVSFKLVSLNDCPSPFFFFLSSLLKEILWLPSTMWYRQPVNLL